MKEQTPAVDAGVRAALMAAYEQDERTWRTPAKPHRPGPCVTGIGSEIETCIICRDPTGRVGMAEDRLETDRGVGPLCEECDDGIRAMLRARQRRRPLTIDEAWKLANKPHLWSRQLALLSLAVAIQEAGRGLDSRLAVEKNNFHGLHDGAGCFRRFGTPGGSFSGFRYLVSSARYSPPDGWNIPIDARIAHIATIYCPDAGAGNGPGASASWAASVTSIYHEMEERFPDFS